MRIAIVGGTAGFGLALGQRLARSKLNLVIGSRSAEKGVVAADRIAEVSGHKVEGGANPEVVVEAEVVVVAVPFAGQAGIYESIKPSLAPEVPLIDCTVPLASEVGGKATRMLGVWEGSAAQQARGILGRGIKLASGFHTVMAGTLEADAPVDQDVLVCGDTEAKAAAQAIVEKIEGARFVDCGSLENARVLESITSLLIGINHRYKLQPGAGIRIAGI